MFLNCSKVETKGVHLHLDQTVWDADEIIATNKCISLCLYHAVLCYLSLTFVHY